MLSETEPPEAMPEAPPAQSAPPSAAPEVVVARLREAHEAVLSGRQDPRQLALAQWSREVEQAFGAPPEAFEAGEGWLEQAGEALRLLSELCALKAQAIAPPPGGSNRSSPPSEAEGEGEAGRELPAGGALLDVDPAASSEGGASALQEAALRYLRLREAAQALARQAELFAHHRPRPEQAAKSLLEVLQRLGPWPPGGPGVTPQELLLALGRVLRRQALADSARRAPAPALDWPRMMDRVRALVPPEGEAALEELLSQGQSRSEVIALFLAILELVRVGELWLTEDDHLGIRVGRRRPDPKS